MILLPPANKVCEGYVFTRVCLSTGGLYLGRYPPQDQGNTPGPGTPLWDQVHPWAGTPGQVHPQTRYNPWAGTPSQVHPPGPGTPNRPGTHPEQVPPRTKCPPRTRCPPDMYTPRPGTPPPGPCTTPWDQVHPTRPGTPHPSPRTRYTPPPEQCMLGDTGNNLLECILVLRSFIVVEKHATLKLIVTRSKTNRLWTTSGERTLKGSIKRVGENSTKKFIFSVLAFSNLT